MLCEDAEAWLTLQFLPGLGCARIGRLVERRGSASAVLENRLETAEEFAFARALADDAALDAARRAAAGELDKLAGSGIILLSRNSAAYPQQLAEIADPPLLLYVRGDVEALAQPMLAVIGARGASDYGLRAARRFAAVAAERGLVVVSGAAYGIDAAAHRGALEAGGKTVAVLGCGVDVTYPAEHRQLLEDIAAQGAVVSEFPLGTRPDGFRFPVRNRIISGLSRAVLVVEAGERSGSLITARLALDQNREVLAVPGSIDSPKSSGANWLIRQGATLVQDPEDVFEALSWHEGALPAAKPAPSRPAAKRPAAPPAARPLPPNLTPEARRILHILTGAPADIDRIAELAGLPVTTLQPLLLTLELQGLVRRLPGQLYEKVGT